MVISETYHIPTWVSLVVIVLVLTVSIVISILHSDGEDVDADSADEGADTSLDQADPDRTQEQAG